MTRQEIMDKATNRGIVAVILLPVFEFLAIGGTIIAPSIPVGWQIVVTTVTTITCLAFFTFFVAAIATFFRACDCEEDEES